MEKELTFEELYDAYILCLKNILFIYFKKFTHKKIPPLYYIGDYTLYNMKKMSKKVE